MMPPPPPPSPPPAAAALAQHHQRHQEKAGRGLLMNNNDDDDNLKSSSSSSAIPSSSHNHYHYPSSFQTVLCRLVRRGCASTLLDSPAVHVPYGVLRRITNNFLHSRKLGKGGTSSVYRGVFAPRYSNPSSSSFAFATDIHQQQEQAVATVQVAVKRLNMDYYVSGRSSRRRRRRRNGTKNDNKKSSYSATAAVIKPVLLARQFVLEVEQIAKRSSRQQQLMYLEATYPRIKHPNLLEILGYSINGPFPCIVYRFLPEGSVLDHLLLSPEMSTSRNARDSTGHPCLFNDALARVRVALDTAAGLAFLHSRHMVHRDVKAANILLDKHLRAQLGDYGFAASISSSDDSREDNDDADHVQQVVGTLAYMAPEAFLGHVSPKLDSFAFGVVLLELLTGMPAFDDNLAHPGQDLKDNGS
ncbi:unnamed protein product [Notodromas monacha]|uniref:Protein kinase domain-containing protein n=1 Tax=Notodromas monacha TaxID=399045 RepID=A0A7R9BFC1_9CRUS|nr:unnamed protein product [Notodromas monacha]CAG0914266.1 unnamed protein product [Notodromas monacha]